MYLNIWETHNEKQQNNELLTWQAMEWTTMQWQKKQLALLGYFVASTTQPRYPTKVQASPK
jgi:hypothetical protein